jgi:methionyl-tRNA formyltransferase
MTRAVVFAYHNVGVRCLSVLLAHGVEIPLVVTHRDDPNENVWFGSVAELAARHGIETITPDDPNAPDVVQKIKAAQPDFLFSFYYRHMLKADLLAIPPRGGLNMHGSLLPKYRGRVPVNWAIIKGERETGATLHYMTVKPDAGAIAGRQAVPILPDDTAIEVFHKVTCAAEVCLDRCLPGLLDGTLQTQPMDLAAGAYFGGRRPEDGKIHWEDTAQAIHNLVRAVAPPYPGAYTRLAGKPMRVLRTMMEPGREARSQAPSFYCEDGRCYAECGDGSVLRVLEFELDGQAVTPLEFAAQHGTAPLRFENS